MDTTQVSCSTSPKSIEWTVQMLEIINRGMHLVPPCGELPKTVHFRRDYRERKLADRLENEKAADESTDD